MTANLWAMCPFCTKVFDAKDVPSVEIIIDKRKRHAHSSCIPKEKRIESSLNLSPGLPIAAE